MGTANKLCYKHWGDCCSMYELYYDIPLGSILFHKKGGIATTLKDELPTVPGGITTNPHGIANSVGGITTHHFAR